MRMTRRLRAAGTALALAGAIGVGGLATAGPAAAAPAAAESRDVEGQAREWIQWDWYWNTPPNAILCQARALEILASGQWGEARCQVDFLYIRLLVR
ncbi:hypothetical protein FH609_024875 [Streptomyces sp. 3MP-14]|uniref:Uncharacterized protein n=1 Tax=Streptomyces mimosae TaxID=2586635 RepID=A0A5N6A2M0_9ACTN|nr:MULTISPECIES: hypothetical protein [Streptomyces]KAB8162146.1 hypothetical protein FH607_021860 [Streptomyces mimosae]KAB8173956.1 hypothetical protein FH609_024875 [Streptomyces sp. 3MP-14]